MSSRDSNGLLTEGSALYVFIHGSTAVSTLMEASIRHEKSSAEVTVYLKPYKISTVQKIFLPSMFPLAQFLDAFNNSALFPAIPIITEEMRFAPSETVWMISGYQLTFAAFLLVMSLRSFNVQTKGKLTTPVDTSMSTEWWYIRSLHVKETLHRGVSCSWLIGGFTKQKITLLVLRALGGIDGALTIPSALSPIVKLFSDPSHQARAISLFGSAGAICRVMGIIIGAVFMQYAGWSWIFWFVAIVGIGIGTVCFFLFPNARIEEGKKVKFDALTVTLLTVTIILFIFAVTSSSIRGWGMTYVLAPLLFSLLLFTTVLFWEAYDVPDDAVPPPRIWHYRNFGVLAGLPLLPYLC